MAKVYASGAYNADSPSRLDAIDTSGHVKRLVSTIELAANTAIATIISFGTVPDGVKLLGASVLRADVLTGLTSFSLGTDTDADCLMAAVDIHAGGAFGAVSAVDIASLNKAVWALEGGTASSGSAEILGTLGASNTVAGTLTLELLYVTV